MKCAGGARRETDSNIAIGSHYIKLLKAKDDPASQLDNVPLYHNDGTIKSELKDQHQETEFEK
jgi:hypothetical protein